MSVVIASYARTPFVRFTGVFGEVPATRLGAAAAIEALRRAGVRPDELDRVIAGQVLQAAAGQNPARQTAVAAGVPLTVPASTLNAVCLSGAEAVADGARLIRAGEAEIVLAVGQESMSMAPHAHRRSRAGMRYGSIELVDTLELDGLTDASEHRSMGASTEARNAALNIGRAEQDAWAERSHRLLAAAQEMVAGEIVPVKTGGRRPVTVTADDGLRAETTIESLAELRPAFGDGGSITAGTSSQISDGAAALVLMDGRVAASRGVPALAEIISHAIVAGPDVGLHAQPSAAIRAVLDRTDLRADDLVGLEINEAFAAVAVHSVRELGIDPGLVNPHGGAIALGHPIGASGARIIGHLARTLHDIGTGRFGATGICGGGGQGSAMLLRSL
ncbi:acetyl-CoA C-acyltransferase [Schumannella soli]|uniref:Probable acetyl-CoA acetyltransferase n=1 Tax=Schumannella soli TaxID=2590779 RepID=A0A506Y908_9MICO|nr:acetyl-CoA C-acyltransferase [Schumannella soli]TPW77558.1 acetyl-CoA C-acyltransferase [Schumannella soli]